MTTFNIDINPYLLSFNPYLEDMFRKMIANSMAYGIRRFNAAFIRQANSPYPEQNQSSFAY